MRGVVLLFTAALAAPGAHAASIVQTATLAERPVGWSDTLGFAQADPAVGPLTALAFTLTGTVGGTLAIENRDIAARTAATRVDGTVASGGALYLETRPTSTTTTALAAYDGATDFAGASGRTVALATGSATASRTYNRGAGAGATDLSAFVGTGAVAVPVAASVTSSVTAGGNVTARITPAAGATGTLTFTQDATGREGQITGGAVAVYSPPPFDFPVALLAPETRATAAQVRTFAPAATGWSEALTFQPFDVSLGALWSVTLELALPASAAQSFTSLGGEGQIVQEQHARLALMLGDATLAAVATSLGDMFDLAAFATVTTTGESAAAEATESLHADLRALASGADPFTLSLLSTGSSTVHGPGAIAYALDLLAGARVSLAYNYAVGPGELTPVRLADGSVAYDVHGRLVPFAVPAPAGLTLLAAPLALLAWARRRR